MAYFDNAAAEAQKLNDLYSGSNPATKYGLPKAGSSSGYPSGIMVGGGQHSMFRTMDDVRKFFSRVSPAEYSSGQWSRKGNHWEQALPGGQTRRVKWEGGETIYGGDDSSGYGRHSFG